MQKNSSLKPDSISILANESLRLFAIFIHILRPELSKD